MLDHCPVARGFRNGLGLACRSRTGNARAECIIVLLLDISAEVKQTFNSERRDWKSWLECPHLDSLQPRFVRVMGGLGSANAT